MPHPDKVDTNGEDPHMVSSCGRVIAVADGVGGGGWITREVFKSLKRRYVNETNTSTEIFKATTTSRQSVQLQYVS